MKEKNEGMSKITLILIIIIVLLIIGFSVYIIKQNTEKNTNTDSGTGIEEISVKVDNKKTQLSAENAKEYYGKEVVNYNQNGLKYRLFYIDFDGKYGEKGTAYIIADYTEEDVKLTSYKTYEEGNISIMKKLNPQWASSDGTIDNKNEKIVSWLCNPKEWSKYANENANYAVGGPSLEMYIDSYKQVMNITSYKTRVAQYGYEISPDGEKNWYQSAKNRFTEDNNEIYISSSGDYWLSSMSAGNENCIYSISFNEKGIASSGYGETHGFRPLVSLKTSFKLELK